MLHPFGIFFLNATKACIWPGYLHSRSDGKLFNAACLRAKTKVREILVRNILFADDAAVATHSQDQLQSLMDRFSLACKDFGLILSLKKTNVMGQGTDDQPRISVDNYEHEAVSHSTYLGSTISSNILLDTEVDKRIGKAATTFAGPAPRMWDNPKLTIKTKVAVYNTCVVRTLLYGSEMWRTYARQEKRLNSFHIRCLRRILGIL